MSKKFLKRRMTQVELRLPRPDSYFHVYTHSVQGLRPFHTDDLKEAWRHTLARRLPGAYATPSGPEVFDGIEVVSEAVMDNHPHLILLLGEDTTQLSRFVGNALRAFALRYNHVSGHTGQVFLRPFEAKLLPSPADVRREIMYVHRNPKREELILRNTSHGAYINEGQQTFVSVKRGLELFGGRDAYAEQFDRYCKLKDAEEGR